MPGSEAVKHAAELSNYSVQEHGRSGAHPIWWRWATPWRGQQSVTELTAIQHAQHTAQWSPTFFAPQFVKCQTIFSGTSL